MRESCGLSQGGRSRRGLKLCKVLKLFYYQSDFHNVDLFLVPLASRWNLTGYRLTYSPQDYASTTAIVEIAVGICLKALKSLLGGAFRFWEAVFFCRILQELYGWVVLNFNHFQLKNTTFNQNILFSNAVLDLLNHSGFLVWISPISAA